MAGMAELYINRELSWLKFNERVLEEACREDTPPLERLKFVAIFSSNLDEFYMVRVGSLLDQSLVQGGRRENKTGMLPREQIDAINREVTGLYPYRDNAYFHIMEALAGLIPAHTSFRKLDSGERGVVKAWFETDVLPLLSPQIIDARHPFPHLENRTVYVGVRLKSHDSRLFGIVPLPHEVPRVYPCAEGRAFLLLEDVVRRYADLAFGSYTVEGKALLRVTRNADINISDGLFDEETDYREYMQDIIRKRSKLSPVRLETDSLDDTELAAFFLSRLGLNVRQCFLSKAPLDMGFVWKMESKVPVQLRGHLLYPPFRPQWPVGLAHERVLPQVRDRDLLLSYPFESMRPFIELLREAADDPRVVSIQMSLYRVGRQSQVVQHLCAAAENGKEVTVIIELRARFDEQNNINWSNVLEDAGCRVIYGLDSFKIHGKVLLITRRGLRGMETITNISTGNYNENTARQYTDLSLTTSDPEIGADARDFFQNMSIGNVYGKYRRLLVAPSTLKSGLLARIDGETQKVREGRPGRIVAKMNSLTDRKVMDHLVKASQAGVSVRLIVRGICCLRPGVPGFTEHMEVRSIVGRFLEHSRIYLFGAGAERQIYISSADWMTRNTERRVEVAAPVRNPALADRLEQLLELLLQDNQKARVLGPDGNYTPAKTDKPPMDSQAELCARAIRRAESRREMDNAGWLGWLRQLWRRPR